jgi:hypothetical protein
VYALRRSRVLLPAVFVAVVIVVGVLAVKSRGDTSPELKTVAPAANCPPIARADAAATMPDLPIAIDVLANDNDPDGDPLVFQIVKTEGGSSAIDDGGTPTDASDDRLLFTPANPTVPSATIEYQALDPQGGFGSSTVAVSINTDASLPAGVRSALLSDPPSPGYSPAKCAGDTTTTSSDVTNTTVSGPIVTTISGTTTTVKATTTVGTSGRRSATTTTAKKSTKATTTTAKKSTGTTSSGGGGGGSNTTYPPSNPTQPTTTRPPSSGTTSPPATTPPDCGSPNPGDPNYNPDFAQCVRNR